MTIFDKDLVIVGGGLSGLVLALTLKKKHGIESKIYERQPATFNETGSMALTPNALRILDHVGVYDRIVAGGAAARSPGVQLITNQGHPLGMYVLGSEARYGYDAVRTYRNLVHRYLLEKAVAEGIEVHFETRVLSVARDDGNGVTLNLEDGATVDAGLVICADGIHSALRTHIDPTAGAIYAGQTVVMASVPAKDIDMTGSWAADGCSVAVFGAEGSFFILSADAQNDNLWCFTTVELPDRSREEWSSLARDSQALADIFNRFNLESWPRIVRDAIHHTPNENFTIWPFRYVSPLPNYYSPSGRVVLIGDAAHAVPPSAGQSGAMALEDAETLAYTIARHRDKPGDTAWDGLLKRWQDHRRERIREVIELTKALSLVRRGLRDDTAARAGKEQNIRQEGKQQEDRMNWLYGYDLKQFVALLEAQ